MNCINIKLGGCDDWEDWHKEAQELFESMGFWDVVTGAPDRKTLKPCEVTPPGPESTVDRQLAYERFKNGAHDNDLREWEHKQRSSFVIIWKSCEGEARKQIEKHGLGQIAYTALREMCEFWISKKLPEVSDSLPFNHLCHIRRHEAGSLEDFAERVRSLAVTSTQNGYEVPEWMICHFFYVALDLNEGADYALMKAGTLSLEGMITILHEYWLEEARQYILGSGLLAD